MKHVVVFGVFDILHPGHLYFLRQAKKQGELTVIVTRDARAKKEKGRKPFFSQGERVKRVRAIKQVDRAILGDKIGEWKVLKKLKPSIVCVGYDQDAENIEKCELEKLPKIVKIGQYKKYSSSKYARH